MNVWITKYALTTGILCKNAEVCAIDEKMIKVCGFGYCHKPYWHQNKAEAVAHAEKMRKAKIASLRKAIAKLETMSFAEED